MSGDRSDASMHKLADSKRNWELQAVAAEAATGAAAIIRGRRGANSLATKSSPTDIVTQVDIDVESHVRSVLRQATPSCGFVGEEGGADGLSSDLVWIIDPLDGTVNFIYDLPCVAVSIACAVDGEIVAGAVADVHSGEVFFASLGNGAFYRSETQPTPVTISTSTVSELPLSLVGTGFSYDSELRRAQGALVSAMLPKCRDIRCFGSAALHLCWVGMGRLDGYFERDIKLWDWAAGSLIAAEAGARLQLPCPENSGLVLAATQAIFDPMIEATATKIL